MAISYYPPATTIGAAAGAREATVSVATIGSRIAMEIGARPAVASLVRRAGRALARGPVPARGRAVGRPRPEDAVGRPGRGPGAGRALARATGVGTVLATGTAAAATVTETARAAGRVSAAASVAGVRLRPRSAGLSTLRRRKLSR
ncbi:hypothetical protein EXIGLDRAFT_328921 [Exidia glandulosa HHB12029]|uniref:Uncharacterized protein n=1 Tax=Exidia glandulosa HHB12029 TaxID=1314781 RepID=A0A165LQ37_EXIGL|nr:hypothetical protein EXIGLDRAFT_328921 [Exidia glandulosa HHB12029]